MSPADFEKCQCRMSLLLRRHLKIILFPGERPGEFILRAGRFFFFFFFFETFQYFSADFQTVFTIVRRIVPKLH